MPSESCRKPDKYWRPVYHPEIVDLAGIKDRAQCRLFEVGDVRVPGTAEIAAAIIGLLSDLDNLRVVSHAADKVMDIQAAKAAARQRSVVLEELARLFARSGQTALSLPPC